MSLPILDNPEFFNSFFKQGEDSPSDSSEFQSLSPECHQLGDKTAEIHIFKNEPAEPHILYFPAEFDTPSDLAFLAKELGKYGYTFSVVNWLNTQTFNQALDVAKTCFLEFKKWMQENGRTGQIIIMGRALGTAIALDVAESVQKELLCLILESAFHTTDALFEGLNLDKSQLTENEDPFCNREKMAKLEKPVLLIHSHRDKVIPVQDIEWLVCESRSKASQFQIAGANSRNSLAQDCGELYFQTINNFINLRLGRRPKRKSWRERKATA